jgi:hypothetical protein
LQRARLSVRQSLVQVAPRVPSALGDEKQNHAADGYGYRGHEPPIDTFAFEKLKAQRQRHQRIGGNQRRYKRDRPAAESGIHRKNGGAVAQSNGCEPQRAAAVEFVFGRTARHKRSQDQHGRRNRIADDGRGNRIGPAIQAQLDHRLEKKLTRLQNVLSKITPKRCASVKTGCCTTRVPCESREWDAFCVLLSMP